jgi:hypothetical protein
MIYDDGGPETEGPTVDDPTDTRAEWDAGTNPDPLLELARPLEKLTTKHSAARERRRKLYDRRLRLFGCGCARMVWDVLPTDARSAVALSERHAYGGITRGAVDAAAVRVTRSPVTFQQHALCAAGYADFNGYAWSPADAARSAAKARATRAAGQAPPRGSPQAVEWELAWCRAFAAARAHQAELVRDIFPPPEHAVRSQRLKREWLTSTVLTLARQADETGEYGALPILADALQDAGCDNEYILARCRAESGIHSRGNWVVDLLLGRE